jgi:sterol desaturase/sphingolipid hydroxylase (fatty acid hydroxylase superfamily)
VLSVILDNNSSLRLAALLLMVFLVGTWELWKPRRPLRASKLQRWSNNWLISALNSVLLPLVFPILAVAVAVLAAQRHWGLFNALELHQIIVIPLFILLFDLTIYWQHRLYHKIPWLWRLHRMHHADPDFDLSTGIRFHPISIILSMLIKMLVIVLLGPPPVAVLLAEIILNVTAMFNHGNIYLPPRIDAVLRLFLVTPDMHRVHHSVAPDETNTNFGFNFPWWDRLFGSYRAQPRDGHSNMDIGVRGFQGHDTQRIDRLLLHPWCKPESPKPEAAPDE